LNQIIKTSDGSHTIYVPEIDEHYHSVHGAVQESTIIFINSGFDFCKADPISILEVGFGTGLNALLTAIKSIEGTREVNYTSIENYPLDMWERSINVNLTGTFLCSQVFGLVMAQAGKGSIINIASTYGLVAPNQDLYV